jgi:hypothetical protein
MSMLFNDLCLNETSPSNFCKFRSMKATQDAQVIPCTLTTHFSTIFVSARDLNLAFADSWCWTASTREINKFG